MYDDYSQMHRYEESLQRAAEEYQAAQRQGLLVKKFFSHLYERAKKVLTFGANKAVPKPEVESVAC